MENLDASVTMELEELTSPSSPIPVEIASVVAAIKQADKGNAPAQYFNYGLLVRFLFSALVDADRTDTAEFEFPSRHRRIRKPDWGVLLKRLDSRIASMPATSHIDRLRRDVSDACLAHGAGKRGCRTLTVPTGGGKTLSSLRFALAHAQKHDLDRIVFVVPFTSIIDQNAAVVRDILEPDGVEPGSVVLEHHSNILPDRETWKSKILSENWNAPVVMTTGVQFLKTLFGGGTQTVRRLHQLARAVVVLDEAQSMPIKCFHMFANAANFLTEQCGSSLLFCTATQPPFDAIPADLGAVRFSPNAEVAPDVDALSVSLKRVDILPRLRPHGWSDGDIMEIVAKEVAQADSCLVVVNTRRSARTLFSICTSRLPAAAVFHLSTNMCQAHRKRVLAELRRRLDLGLPTVCVSTQLIEAGVDVDFGGVVRYLAGLDSILQAAGRCNRHGKRAIGRVHVVNHESEDVQAMHEVAIGQETTRRVLDDFKEDPDSLGGDLLSPAASAMYFRYYHAKLIAEMTYATDVGRRDSLLELLSTNAISVEEHIRISPVKTSIPLKQAFKSASDAFAAIDMRGRGVVVPYGEGADVIAELSSEPEPARKVRLLRLAQPFTVNVSEREFQKLAERNAVTEVSAGAGIFRLSAMAYHADYGLHAK
jgi:CRISPR-associated endonuclease/helicase Cas3